MKPSKSTTLKKPDNVDWRAKCERIARDSLILVIEGILAEQGKKLPKNWAKGMTYEELVATLRKPQGKK